MMNSSDDTHDNSALVIVNPRARRGSAAERYDVHARAQIEAALNVDHTIMDAGGKWLDAIDHARRSRVERVIAVGGDGTVHAIANALLSDGPRGSRRIALGAVGLGSSNDFHKPVRSRGASSLASSSSRERIPIRIGAPMQRDVGLAKWEDARGVQHARWFVVSASIGLTARANRRFSQLKDGIGGRLASKSVDAAIVYSALHAMAGHENLSARLRASLEHTTDASTTTRTLAVSNLSVMLTPYLAGSFRFDASGGCRSSGRFDVHLCEDMGRAALFATMVNLLRGRFEASPKARSWSTRALSLDLDDECDLELDGELFRARSNVSFEAFPNALRVCT